MIKLSFSGEIPDGFKGKIIVVFKDELFVESYQFIRNVYGFNNKTSRFTIDKTKKTCFEWPNGGTGDNGDKIK